MAYFYRFLSITAALQLTLFQQLYALSTVQDQQLHYDPTQGVATYCSTFIGVKQHSKAITPPNIAVPAYRFITTLKQPHKNSKSTQGKRKLGGNTKNTSLWGIPVQGPACDIIDSSGTTIGQLWTDSKIAQLNDGSTLVGVLLEKASTQKSGYFARGPVWTWYSNEALTDLQKRFNITPSSLNVITVGTITQGKQKYTLHGINLTNPIVANPISQPTSSKQSQSKSSTPEKDTKVPGMD